MPHQPEFQDFHLDTMERANHNAETSNIASIESDSQDKKVKKLYLPLAAAAAPLPVGVITQAMRRVYRRVEALVEEVPTKQVPSCSSLKRGRAAEFHNLSEKRRRSRINEKNESIAEGHVVDTIGQVEDP